VDREDPAQAGDPEDLQEWFVRADHPQRPVVRAGPLEGVDQDSEAAGIQEAHCVQVHNQVVMASADQVGKPLAQLRSGHDVKIAAHAHYRALMFDSDRGREIHGFLRALI
jgi:hypothetical protein